MTISRLLTGRRIRLTAVKPEDSAVLTQWYEDNLFARQLDGSVAYPRREAQVNRWLSEERGKDSFMFAIRPLDEETLLGYADLDGILWHHGVSWMSIGIGPAHQNQGYGHEALQLLLEFAFHELNLFRVQLTVFEYNERALHLYEKLGFVREGVFREALHRDGKRYHMYLYGILRHEWEAQHIPPLQDLSPYDTGGGS
jgi:RimJ/RimL family protein N-acetyltransferase